MINTNDLIELRAKAVDDGTRVVVAIDTQGERVLNAAECYTLASRLVDLGQNIDDRCPLVPYLDQLVVRIIEETDRVSGGGVAIPDNTYEIALRGVVHAIGPRISEKDFINPPQIGDIITFSRNAGTVIKVGDTPWLVMKAHYALTRIAVG